jgi:LPS export ABC transporter protein LptC
LLGALLGGAACRSEKVLPAVAHNALADSADQVMFKTVANLTDRGVLKGQMRADTGYFFDDNTRLVGRTVQVTFFTVTGAPNGVLTSREGTYNERTGNMDAHGDVVVVSENGRRLKTPYLKYIQSGNLISSDTTFTTTDSTGRELDGIGFISDPNMDHMQCLRACNGTAGMVNLEATPAPPAAPRPGVPPTSAAPGQARPPARDTGRPKTFTLP